jgi:hypothetical protein
MKNSVGVLYTGSFYTADTDDQITGLAAFTETMTPAPPVPEPSSLLALASLGAGALGFLRKRKQA